MFRERSCDLIIGLGGGSSMDSAKAVSLLIGNGGKFHDYTERRVGTEWKRGRSIDKKGPHVITVPTTAGTGADVTAGCGVFDPTPASKAGPEARMCDPPYRSATRS